MIKEKLNSTFEKINGAIFEYNKRFLYTSIRDLRFTMRDYIDLVVNYNLKALKRKPCFVKQSDLRLVFERLQLEYAELSNNKEYSAQSKRNDAISVLIRKHEILRACGVVFTINPKNKDVLDFLDRSNIKGNDIIKRLESELKSIELRLAELKALGNNNKTAKKHEKVTLEDYMQTFAVLSKNGHQCSIDMSVLDFIQKSKLWKREVEENNREIERIKSKRK